MIGFKQHPPVAREDIVRNMAFHEAAHIIVGACDGLRVVNLTFNALVADDDSMHHAQVTFNGAPSLRASFAGVAAYCYLSGEWPTPLNIRHLIDYSGSRKDLADTLAFTPELFCLEECALHARAALDCLYEHEAEFVRLAVTLEGAMQSADVSIRGALSGLDLGAGSPALIDTYTEPVSGVSQDDALSAQWGDIVRTRAQRPWNRFARWLDFFIDRARMRIAQHLRHVRRSRLNTRTLLTRTISYAAPQPVEWGELTSDVPRNFAVIEETERHQ